jgi:hypothetical protein
LRGRVGLDKISDFTTNLIKDYLVELTERFAREHIDPTLCADITVKRIRFNYTTETWEDEIRYLPVFRGDYVLLTPIDILVHNDTWINRSDMIAQYPVIAAAVEDDVLRDRVDRYFQNVLGKSYKQSDVNAARASTLQAHPWLLDVYIRMKEEAGEGAAAVSEEELAHLRGVFVDQFADLVSRFWMSPDLRTRAPLTSFDEAKHRCSVFKKWVEDKDGWRSLNDARRRASEAEVQRLIHLTLQASDFDVNREVNNGRGPVDFKVSKGAIDSTLIEVKLASNSSLKRNLENQVEVYKAANETKYAVKLIVAYTASEQARVDRILKALDVAETDWLVVVDARSDNKPSGSKA